jgi:ABC-2 type transport system permease protein
VSEPRPLGSAALVRLVAGREIATRIRDKSFLISSLVIVLLLVGAMGVQIVLNSGADETRLGVVGAAPALRSALETHALAVDVDLTLVEFADEDAARAAVRDGDVDGALVGDGADHPELLVERSAGGPLRAVVTGAVGQVSLAEQLAAAGIDRFSVPEVAVTALDPEADQKQQRSVIAVIGVAILYGLLIMFGQFVAQGVVEEKSSRVVELLLATMRPWQLLAGKVLGLGLLGLAQIVLIGTVGVAGALAFGVADVPGELIGTVGWVVAWFVLGYALYASIYAVAASLVSRQEDLPAVLTPTTILLVVSFLIAIQAAGDPGSTFATVTSYVPGLSPLVMPVRLAAGEAGPAEVGLAVLFMLVAIALVVRLGGRVYAGALLRTGGRTKLREALRAQRTEAPAA